MSTAEYAELVVQLTVLALAIFLPAVERRLGIVPTALLVIACGSLGALAAVGMDSALGDGFPIAAGGNGIALGVLGCWLVFRDSEQRRDPTAEYDQIAVAVAAAVLLLLPLIEDYASAWAGLAGGLVGLGCGLGAALGQPSAFELIGAYSCDYHDADGEYLRTCTGPTYAGWRDPWPYCTDYPLPFIGPFPSVCVWVGEEPFCIIE